MQVLLNIFSPVFQSPRKWELFPGHVEQNQPGLFRLQTQLEPAWGGISAVQQWIHTGQGNKTQSIVSFSASTEGTGLDFWAKPGDPSAQSRLSCPTVELSIGTCIPGMLILLV